MTTLPLIDRDLIYPAGISHSNFADGVEAGSDARATAE
jgi:hypothetical protein